MMVMRPTRRLPLVRGTITQSIPNVDLFDHEHAVVKLDHAFSIGYEPALIGGDPARLQRATKGSGQSTGGGGDDVIECGGVGFVRARRRAVMFGDLIMDAEEDGLGFRGQAGTPERSLDPFDCDARHVGRFSHRCLSCHWRQ